MVSRLHKAEFRGRLNAARCARSKKQRQQNLSQRTLAAWCNGQLVKRQEPAMKGKTVPGLLVMMCAEGAGSQINIVKCLRKRRNFTINPETSILPNRSKITRGSILKKSFPCRQSRADEVPLGAGVLDGRDVLDLIHGRSRMTI